MRREKQLAENAFPRIFQRLFWRLSLCRHPKAKVDRADYKNNIDTQKCQNCISKIHRRYFKIFSLHFQVFIQVVLDLQILLSFFLPDDQVDKR